MASRKMVRGTHPTLAGRFNMKILRLSLKGFKTIKYQDNLEFDENLNLLIGANGSGKSNLISFFEMMSFMMTNHFQQYLIENGFASTLLYFGPKITAQIEAMIDFSFQTGESRYDLKLSPIAGDIAILNDL
jgi:predicted ATPase